MALKYCPECGSQVSEFAIQCIKCGYPINSNNNISKTSYLSNDKINNSEVSNVYAWIIAFTPIIGTFVQGFMFGFMNSFNSNHYYNFDSFWWVYIVLNSIFCVVDIQNLQKNNINTKGKYLSLWGFFFVPVYLFKRAELLNQNQTYFWIWILAFLISLFI
ncbi:zinc-ribbon domain-containing protein [Flavobacterium aciduliphilum]|uniref:Zinc ribbon protein n=1 Tax=Flavobacterium aciduliphilum TaxID=1101402 RepID=A0A328YHH2_9FLAO|nr:zinc-ribbon domain-containing protein [Flavobacterium aciduliphilum]RAR72553.1 zinc ribbon protein [Flavobacterium aciduliphilum]